MTSLQCVEAFSPAQLREEQNHEGYEAPKQTISTQVGWGHYTVSPYLHAISPMIYPCEFWAVKSQVMETTEINSINEVLHLLTWFITPTLLL